MKKYQVPLFLLGSQHLAVKGKINSVSVILLIDTGASNTCIDHSLKDELLLETEDYAVRGTGAGAADLQLWQSHNNSLQLRHFKKLNCSLLLMDLSVVNQAMRAHGLEPIHGVIGADLLVEHQAIIDYRELKMELIKQ